MRLCAIVGVLLLAAVSRCGAEVSTGSPDSAVGTNDNLLHSLSLEAMDRPPRFPAIVGGLGGSGTRAWAVLLQKIGCQYSGLFRRTNVRTMNGALDLLFVTEEMRDKWGAYTAADGRFVVPSKPLPQEMVDEIDAAVANLSSFGYASGRAMAQALNDSCWMWKAPASAIFLPAIKRMYPEGFTFVHVVRDVRDIILTGMPYGLFLHYRDLIIPRNQEERRALPRCHNATFHKNTQWTKNWRFAEMCPRVATDWSAQPLPVLLQNPDNVPLTCMRMMVRAWRQFNMDILNFKSTEMTDDRYRYVVAQTDRLAVGSSHPNSETVVQQDNVDRLKEMMAAVVGRSKEWAEADASVKGTNQLIGPTASADNSLLAHYGKWRHCHPQLLHLLEQEAGDALRLFGYQRVTAPGKYVPPKPGVVV